MNRKIPVIALLVLLNTAFVIAQEKITVDSILEQMTQKEKNTETIELEFIQSVYFLVIKETNAMSGKIIFKRPGKINFQVFASTAVNEVKQTIVSNGDMLWIFNVQANQVYVDKWKNWKGIGYFMPGMYNPKGKTSDLKKYFNFTLIEETAESYKLLLKLKKNIDMGPQLPIKGAFDFNLWISKKDLNLIKSELINENVTVVTGIKSYKINEKYADDVFNFKIPQDAEVLRLFK
ncbi:MAG: hypothetical protein A2252_05405 [Elusimicrobia bacterium RIFOXYA2_FULL_39_19]|nr:MAG: hypothetical protein A2252_05405 [Elusimicrobia bacterium RIFOXYA2_FULL_39_19]